MLIVAIINCVQEKLGTYLMVAAEGGVDKTTTTTITITGEDH